MPYEPLPHHNISLFCKNNNTLDRRRCEAKATMQKFVGSVLEAKEVHVLTYEENTYEGGPKSNRKHFLVGGPVVVHASAARYLLRGPFCISLPTGIVE